MLDLSRPSWLVVVLSGGILLILALIWGVFGALSPDLLPRF